MKIILPHREVDLNISHSNIPSIEERKKIVEKILAEEIVFHSETMTVEEYLAHTWKKDSSKSILDMLGYYLSKDSPTEDQTSDTDYFGKPIVEDRFILSENQKREMKKGSKKYKTVQDLNYELYMREQYEKNKKKKPRG